MGTVHSGAVQTAQRDELPKREGKSRSKPCLITGFRARRHPAQRGLWADGWAGARLKEYGVNLRSPINDGLNCMSALREPCAGITARDEYTGLNAAGCAVTVLTWMGCGEQGFGGAAMGQTVGGPDNRLHRGAARCINKIGDRDTQRKKTRREELFLGF